MKRGKKWDDSILFLQNRRTYAASLAVILRGTYIVGDTAATYSEASVLYSSLALQMILESKTFLLVLHQTPHKVCPRSSQNRRDYQNDLLEKMTSLL